jgi:hypothetical protein
VSRWWGEWACESADPLAPVRTGSGANGGEAVSRRRGDGAPATVDLDPYRTPVRMRRLGGWIAEDVLGEAQQSAQSFSGRMEHMFARLGGAPDGTWAGAAGGVRHQTRVSPVAPL